MSEQAVAHESTPMVQRRLEQFQLNNARVIARYFGAESQGSEGLLHVIGGFLSYSEDVRKTEWEATQRRFASRHRHFSRVLRRFFARLVRWLEMNGNMDLVRLVQDLSERDQLLLSSYVTCEYSVESAAFFNPSIVAHPSQEGLPRDSMRFIMSFRATGEGHISSVAFRSGLLDGSGKMHLDPVSPYISTPVVETHRKYDKELFARKLKELGAATPFTEAVTSQLPDSFTREDLESAFAFLPPPGDGADRENAIRSMRWLAESNYAISFDDDEDVCERVIFPVSPAEAHGIEDARFVRFVEEDGSVCYYATYTAYSGTSSSIQLIETHDFQRFEMCTLNGPAVLNKGMALFPRRINGDYCMLGRQDGRSVTIARSRHLHFWYEWQPIIQPRQPWEIVKLGNCGSPIETPEGWIVLTHGIGPVRRYCIGAALLDLEDPSTVIGRLKRPLIEPLESEREGYVPNVVYTCGAIIHGDQLVIPYAMSDTRSGVATTRTADLVAQLLSDGP